MNSGGRRSPRNSSFRVTSLPKVSIGLFALEVLLSACGGGVSETPIAQTALLRSAPSRDCLAGTLNFDANVPMLDGAFNVPAGPPQKTITVTVDPTCNFSSGANLHVGGYPDGNSDIRQASPGSTTFLIRVDIHPGVTTFTIVDFGTLAIGHFMVSAT
jgi:hypothetical protein